jgi:hypothetical protein
MFKIEDRFMLKVTGDTPTHLVTVGDVAGYIDGLLAARETAVPETQSRAGAPM